ncbi:MAG: DsbA family protein [Alphaproteobacteria bacterium]|nr:DsbA family protein [Alphaproteobacteria bacterium]
MKKINAVYVSLAAFVLSAVALLWCIFGCCGNKTANVEKVLMEKPEIVMDALRAYETKQQENALKAVEEKIKTRADELYNRADDGVIANPDGKIVLVEFFDFSCGYCHRLYPALKEVIAKNPDVRVVAKPMAFLSPTSKYAASVALAAREQGKFAEAYKAMFEAEGRLDNAKVDEIVASLGLNVDQLKKDMDSEKVKNTLSSVSALASDLQVTGVPTLILNNKILQTLDASVIQEAIDAAK